jgi:SulP family sulfate permease
VTTSGKLSFSFRPKLLETLKGYSWRRFTIDLLAGVTVGIVALPLAIGFGIASGASPGTGIYTAILGGFLVSALGGSRVQIGGPAGAFVGLVYLTISKYGMPDLLVCTMMAGVLLFILGATRLGSLIKYIPHPVTTGFTCGIAITIISTQVKDFLGLSISTVPAGFLEKLPAFARALPSISWTTVAVGVLSIALLRLWPRSWGKWVPGSIVVVILGTAAVALLRLPVETIGARFGDSAIPRGLPPFKFPAVNWRHLNDLVRPAIAIALLGSIESLLSAVVADGMVDDRHDSNQELMAQGIANFTGPFFGCIPVTGVLARTATNIRSGARTPVAGMVHALTLLGIVLVAAPLVKFIPLTVLGAVLIVVSIKMGEWDEFLLLRRQTKSDVAVFLVTFVLTVVFDLSVAVEIGMILAAFLFIKRVSDTTEVDALDDIAAASGAFGHEQVGELPKGVLVYRVFGALLFGAVDKLENMTRRAGIDKRVVILHLRAVIAMDATALHALETLHAKLKRKGNHLILCGAHTQPYSLMERAGFLDVLGRESVCKDLTASVARAKELIRARSSGPSQDRRPHRA